MIGRAIFGPTPAHTASPHAPMALASRACAVVLAIAVLAPAGSAQQPRSGGDGIIYMGGYDRTVHVIDESDLTVSDKIQLSTGIPRQLEVSKDGTRMYVRNVGMEHIEVVDLETRRSIDSFTLSEGNTKIRARSMEVDPDEEFLLLAVRSYTKLLDRFEIGESVLVRVDLDTQSITDTIPWPGEPRETADLMFSPDGELLYFFEDDLIALETDGFTEVDRWEISRPLEGGMGPLDLDFPESPHDEEGIFTDLFRFTDPVQDRRLMGIARIDLAARDVDFYTLGPSESVGFVLAPGGRRGYGLLSEIGRYEFWTFDLDGQRVESRVPFPGRPRMALVPSSNGELLYIYNAGNTIDVYDAQTHELLRTVELDADMTDFLMVPASGR